MLLNDSIMRVMDETWLPYGPNYSAREIADAIGEDMFKVHKILSRMSRDGVIVGCQYVVATSPTQSVDLDSFVSMKGAISAGFAAEQDHVFGRLCIFDPRARLFG